MLSLGNWLFCAKLNMLVSIPSSDMGGGLDIFPETSTYFSGPPAVFGLPVKEIGDLEEHRSHGPALTCMTCVINDLSRFHLLLQQDSEIEAILIFL